MEIIFSGSLGESLSFANESQYLVIHRASVRKLLKDISEKGLANLTEVRNDFSVA